MIYVEATRGDAAKWNVSGWELSSQDYLSIKEPLGPIRVKQSSHSSLSAPFLDSCKNAGLEVLDGGFNRGNKSRLGCGAYEFTIRNGRRDSVKQRYLMNSLEDLPNLKVVTEAEVIKVLIGSMGTAAQGVIYKGEDDVEREVMLKLSKGKGKGLTDGAHIPSAVIITAGALKSPTILTNSGICEGCDVVDLEGVGKNLQDHPVIGVIFSVVDRGGEDDISMIGEVMASYESRVGIEGVDSGVLGTAGFSSGAFLRSGLYDGDDPDIQLTVFPRIIEPHFINRDTKENEKKSGEVRMLVTVALVKPDARFQVSKSGSVSIPTGKSTYLSDRDVKALGWGVSEVRRIFGQEPLKSSVIREVEPGVAVTGPSLYKFISSNVMTNNHWAGTARMGNSDDPDPGIVVNEHLMVKQTNNLMVADASVMPHVTNGNVHSSVCVIATKAAQFIINGDSGKVHPGYKQTSKVAKEKGDKVAVKVKRKGRESR